MGSGGVQGCPRCTPPNKASPELLTYEPMLKGKGCVGGMKVVQSLPLCTSIEKPNFREGLWLSEADANNPAHCIPRPCGLGAADVTDNSLQTASLPCQGCQVFLSQGFA